MLSSKTKAVPEVIDVTIGSAHGAGLDAETQWRYIACGDGRS